MKTIYLVRHAKSSWDDPRLRDAERPLNNRGRRDAPFMASLLTRQGLRADALYSSPAVRAHTTAKFFAKALDFDQDDIILKPEIYEAGVDDILDVIHGLPEEQQSVMLFGHNPTFTYVANHFNRGHIDNMPTCSVVEISSEAETWADVDRRNSRVTAFHYPKQHIA